MPVGGALELNGEDLRRQPLEARKRALARLLRGTEAGIALNAHYTRPRARSSRRLRARLRGHRVEAAWLTLSRGRVVCWLKVKNSAAPAVTRETEEEWN